MVDVGSVRERMVGKTKIIPFLQLRFTWYGDELSPDPEIIVYGKKMSDEVMVPWKLRRHFPTKHSYPL